MAATSVDDPEFLHVSIKQLIFFGQIRANETIFFVTKKVRPMIFAQVID